MYICAPSLQSEFLIEFIIIIIRLSFIHTIIITLVYQLGHVDINVIINISPLFYRGRLALMGDISCLFNIGCEVRHIALDGL
jgi:hypothetical protein